MPGTQEKEHNQDVHVISKSKKKKQSKKNKQKRIARLTLPVTNGEKNNIYIAQSEAKELLPEVLSFNGQDVNNSIATNSLSDDKESIENIKYSDAPTNPMQEVMLPELPCPLSAEKLNEQAEQLDNTQQHIPIPTKSPLYDTSLAIVQEVTKINEIRNTVLEPAEIFKRTNVRLPITTKDDIEECKVLSIDFSDRFFVDSAKEKLRANKQDASIISLIFAHALRFSVSDVLNQLFNTVSHQYRVTLTKLITVPKLKDYCEFHGFINNDHTQNFVIRLTPKRYEYCAKQTYIQYGKPGNYKLVTQVQHENMTLYKVTTSTDTNAGQYTLEQLEQIYPPLKNEAIEQLNSIIADEMPSETTLTLNTPKEMHTQYEMNEFLDTLSPPAHSKSYVNEERLNNIVKNKQQVPPALCDVNNNINQNIQINRITIGPLLEKLSQFKESATIPASHSWFLKLISSRSKSQTDELTLITDLHTNIAASQSDSERLKWFEQFIADMEEKKLAYNINLKLIHLGENKVYYWAKAQKIKLSIAIRRASLAEYEKNRSPTLNEITEKTKLSEDIIKLIRDSGFYFDNLGKIIGKDGKNELLQTICQQRAQFVRQIQSIKNKNEQVKSSPTASSRKSVTADELLAKALDRRQAHFRNEYHQKQIKDKEIEEIKISSVENDKKKYTDVEQDIEYKLLAVEKLKKCLMALENAELPEKEKLHENVALLKGDIPVSNTDIKLDYITIARKHLAEYKGKINEYRNQYIEQQAQLKLDRTNSTKLTKDKDIELKNKLINIFNFQQRLDINLQKTTSLHSMARENLKTIREALIKLSKNVDIKNPDNIKVKRDELLNKVKKIIIVLEAYKQELSSAIVSLTNFRKELAFAMIEYDSYFNVCSINPIPLREKVIALGKNVEEMVAQGDGLLKKQDNIEQGLKKTKDLEHTIAQHDEDFNNEKLSFFKKEIDDSAQQIDDIIPTIDFVEENVKKHLGKENKELISKINNYMTVYIEQIQKCKISQVQFAIFKNLPPIKLLDESFFSEVPISILDQVIVCTWDDQHIEKLKMFITTQLNYFRNEDEVEYNNYIDKKMLELAIYYYYVATHPYIKPFANDQKKIYKTCRFLLQMIYLLGGDNAYHALIVPLFYHADCRDRVKDVSGKKQGLEQNDLFDILEIDAQKNQMLSTIHSKLWADDSKIHALSTASKVQTKKNYIFDKLIKFMLPSNKEDRVEDKSVNEAQEVELTKMINELTVDKLKKLHKHIKRLALFKSTLEQNENVTEIVIDDFFGVVYDLILNYYPVTALPFQVLCEKLQCDIIDTFAQKEESNIKNINGKIKLLSIIDTAGKAAKRRLALAVNIKQHIPVEAFDYEKNVSLNLQNANVAITLIQNEWFGWSKLQKTSYKTASTILLNIQTKEFDKQNLYLNREQEIINPTSRGPRHSEPINQSSSVSFYHTVTSSTPSQQANSNFSKSGTPVSPYLKSKSNQLRPQLGSSNQPPGASATVTKTNDQKSGSSSFLSKLFS